MKDVGVTSFEFSYVYSKIIFQIRQCVKFAQNMNKNEREILDNVIKWLYTNFG